MTLESDVDNLFSNITGKLLQEDFHTALKVGGEVIAQVYRGALQVSTPEPGSPSFIHAYLSVSVKVKNFENGAGCYAIVGSVRGRSGRLKAPQTRFGEHGTKERYTKSGAYRGVMPAMSWMQHAVAGSLSDAREAVIASLRNALAKH